MTDSRSHVPHILCVGAAVLDTLFRVRQLPSGEGKVLPWEMMQIAEGMAASAAFSVVRLGGRASLWGAVGDDETGARIIRDLSASGIDTDGMSVVEDARSALSTILVDDHGERLIVPFYDPALHHRLRSCTGADIEPFDAVLVDVRWPALAFEVLRVARGMGRPAILDGDVAPREVLEKLAPQASHIVFSQPAAESLCDGGDIPALLPQLGLRFPGTFISVTGGAAGSWWLEKDGSVSYCPTIAVRAVDTLAAGDIFHGAFALGIASGWPVPDIMRFASVAAALKCTVFGGRSGAPTREAVEKALAEHRDPATALPEQAAIPEPGSV